jgi:hypothetical protein
MYSRRRLLCAIGTGVLAGSAGCEAEEDASRTAATRTREPGRTTTPKPASTDVTREPATSSEAESDTPDTDTETETPEPAVGWSEKQRLPADQSAAGGGVLDGRLYYFGGFESGPKLDATARALVYDPEPSTDGKWDRIADLPARLWAPCGVATSDRVFSFGGAPPDSPYSTGESPTDAIYAYTPGEEWRDLTAEAGVRCPYPNWAMTGAYDPIGELIYCVGGATAVTDRESATDHGTDSDSPGRCDETRIWTFDPGTETVADPDLARLPEGKRWATVGIIGDDGDRYLHTIGGGRGVVGSTDSNYRLDLGSGVISERTPAPRAGMFATTADPVLDGEIYLTHGRFGREYTTLSYRYDPQSDGFEQLTDRPDYVRNRAVDGVIDGRLYVVGGHVKRYARDNYHDATTYNEAFVPPVD